MTSTLKPHAPACDRNSGVILEVLEECFSDRKQVLEVGSGTGQHAVFFAAAMPWLSWQTADLAENLPGIRMWVEEAGLPNLPAPIALEAAGPWPNGPYDAVFSANTLHIMGWEDVQRLFAGLDGVMGPDAVLAVYGPFNYGGKFTSESNAEFDVWLKRRSAASGVRDFEAVNALAEAIGMKLVADHAMPANNRTLVWKRVARSDAVATAT
jgi:cyclopropane fatty-acyl-phospholipid synthase-like methyltransferase